MFPTAVTEGEKQGFSAPDASWFRGESIDYVKSLLMGDDAAIFAFFDPAVVRRLVSDHIDGRENRRLFIWSLLSLEQWCGLFWMAGVQAGRAIRCFRPNFPRWHGQHERRNRFG